MTHTVARAPAGYVVANAFTQVRPETRDAKTVEQLSGGYAEGSNPVGSTPMITHDLVTVLNEDHLQLSRICTELEIGPGSPENRRELADHLIAQLVRHQVGEEPHLPPGPALAGAEDLMRRLEALGPQDARFERVLSQLIRAVRLHLRESGLTRLRARYSAARLRELGAEVVDRRTTSRSVPHPAIADRAPAARVLRTGRGFVDRARAAASVG